MGQDPSTSLRIDTGEGLIFDSSTLPGSDRVPVQHQFSELFPLLLNVRNLHLEIWAYHRPRGLMCLWGGVGVGGSLSLTPASVKLFTKFFLSSL